MVLLFIQTRGASLAIARLLGTSFFNYFSESIAFYWTLEDGREVEPDTGCATAL